MDIDALTDKVLRDEQMVLKNGKLHYATIMALHHVPMTTAYAIIALADWLYADYMKHPGELEELGFAEGYQPSFAEWFEAHRKDSLSDPGKA